VIAQAMAKGGQGAIGRVVLSGNRHLVLVRSTGRLLILDVLHYPATVRAAAAYEAELGGGSATSEELRLATSLIDAASGPINWDHFRDTTAEELTALIEAKLANQPLQPLPDEPKAVLQLLDALKQSVAAVQKNELAVPVTRESSPRRTAG
jgi:DNA end-binding protein Ku